ncbi:MAG TPA: LytTR family DNA-binding domain-containing protein [Bryobacteraceae bacterium]|jgi:two-component system LytT family response regulator|nr:LytTR family DNA-binding domain-containing protein [Bryobacteraceae bacterium]
MPRFKVLIVDDERLSRQRLRRLLALEPECEIVGECADGREAVLALAREAPDILFLDVQMPEMDGFDVVRTMEEVRPLIIFTSAFDEYALRAFEVHAFDYLMKPFDRRRFRESLNRAKSQLTRDRSDSPGDRLLALFEHFANGRRAPDRIAIRNNGRVVFVKIDEVDWIEASDNYVCLHCGKDTHVLRETMGQLESRLDPARFLRVHRSAIVNLDRIKELQPWFRGDYRVILRDGTELTLTKSHREKLESRLLLGA